MKGGYRLDDVIDEIVGLPALVLGTRRIGSWGIMADLAVLRYPKGYQIVTAPHYQDALEVELDRGALVVITGIVTVNAYDGHPLVVCEVSKMSSQYLDGLFQQNERRVWDIRNKDSRFLEQETRLTSLEEELAPAVAVSRIATARVLDAQYNLQTRIKVEISEELVARVVMREASELPLVTTSILSDRSTKSVHRFIVSNQVSTMFPCVRVLPSRFDHEGFLLHSCKVAYETRRLHFPHLLYVRLSITRRQQKVLAKAGLLFPSQGERLLT